MKPKDKIYNNITIWLLVVIFSSAVYSDSLNYFRDQDSLYPDFESVISHPKLNSYLANPDTLNLQLIYGWGKDLFLQDPKVGLWIADTLLTLAKQQKDHRAIISAYSLFGQVHRQQSDYFNSIKSFKDAIRYGEDNLDWDQHPNYDKLGINYVYLGDLYYEMDDLEEAKRYYIKGWNILKQITPEMIEEQNEINKNYHRDYTTYEWDQQFAKLKMGIVYSENKTTLDSGINFLLDIYNTQNSRKELLKINAAFNIGKAFRNNDIFEYNVYLDSAYSWSKYNLLYELQSKIGLFKIENIIQDGTVLDTVFAGEIIEAARKSENIKVLYKTYKIMSDYYQNIDMEISRHFNDSTNHLREILFNSEKQKEIGKLQAEIEYENQIKLAKEAEEEASLKLTITIIVLVAVILFVAVLVYLINQRQRILKELEIKNKTISDQNTKLADLINSREKLIGILGHDLRNPIKGIKLSTSNLRGFNKDESLEDQIKELEISSAEIEKLLNSILDFAESNLSIPENTDDVVDLEELVLNSVKLNKNLIISKDLDIVVDLDIKSVKSNRFVITNIINNTITNAIRFSYRGKTVHITSHSEDGFVILKIKDSGIGIEPENLEKIRNQVKPDIQEPVNAPAGSGFGLLTSISQLEKIGGNLFIESEPGVGTTVLIYLNS